jgi:phage terminase large subunit-like protein
VPRTKPKQDFSSVEAISELSKGLSKFVKAPNIYAYEPHDKQVIFHGSTTKITLYIGGNRSGKTTGGVVEDIWRLRGQHPFKRVPPPPIKGRFIGVDFLNGIDQIALPQFSRWLPIGDLKGGSWYSAYDSYERILRLENDSELKFMSYEQDTDKFSGTSQDFVHFDEEPPQDIYKENLARTIDSRGALIFTMTPVEGMTWLYDEIYEPGILKQNPNITVVEVDMTDNPYLAEGEIQIFLSTLDDDEKAARVHGKYVQRGGLIYKGFDPKIHVIEEFDHKQPGLMIAAAMDHGFNNPTAFGWFAVDNDERVTLFHEYYQSGHTVDYHAEKYKEINKQLAVTPEYVVGDPSIRNTQAISGTSISEEYARLGVPILLGNNQVKDGIVRVARFLAKRGDGQPGFRITKDCQNFLREVRRYRWKTYQHKKAQYQNNAQETPQKKDDHLMDMTRYFIMSRPDLTPGILEQKQPRRNPLGYATVASDIDESLADLRRRMSSGYDEDGDYIGTNYSSGSTHWSISDNIEGDW